MEALITGGTGFIGQQWVKRLLSRGYSLTVLSRSPLRAKRLLTSQVNCIDAFDALPSNYSCDVVVNLAGEPLDSGRWTARKKKAIWDSRILTTRRLVHFIHTLPKTPRVLLSGSAIGYYGPQGKTLCYESSAPSPGFTHELCHAWEQEALRAQSSTTRVCLIRTGVILGRTGGILKKLKWPFSMGLGCVMGQGENGFSWCHIDDYVNLLEFCIKHPSISGPINATAPHPTSFKAFSHTLAKSVHRSCRLKAPAWCLKVLLGEMAQAMLLEGQWVYPQTCLDAGFKFEYPTLESALTQLFNT